MHKEALLNALNPFVVDLMLQLKGTRQRKQVIGVQLVTAIYLCKPFNCSLTKQKSLIWMP